MKKISRHELAKSIAQQLIDGADRKDLMRHIAAYLVEHKMTQQAGMLMDDIAIELQNRTGHVSAEVRAAFPLTPDNRKGIEEYVKRMTDAKTVEVSFTEDKGILGGMIVKTPEFEYDASVRHKLKQLARGKV